MKIAVIGAGWYGCHLALELTKQGHEVEIFEKNSSIFSGISGNYGIRLHRGPHYPSSKPTRDTCINTFEQFKKLYPELIVEHEHSYYALGDVDAHGNPPKVDQKKFDKVCHETSSCKTIPTKDAEFMSIQALYDINEPSIALGSKLRTFFQKKLSEAHIPIHLDSSVENIRNTSEGVTVNVSSKELPFNYVINATSFKELTPLKEKLELPVDLKITYQACISLAYKDKQPSGDKPFSFIVMDGWFPCIMPTVCEAKYDHTYILTHGCYTITASCQTPELAQSILNSYTDDFINKGAKASCEKDVLRYCPNFLERFEYIGWKGAVIAKPITKSEFRAAITFSQGNTIHIIPGKVSNVINAAAETLKLLDGSDCTVHKGVCYANGGVLDLAKREIEEHPSKKDNCTTNLNIIDSIPTGWVQRNSVFAVKNTGGPVLHPPSQLTIKV